MTEAELDDLAGTVYEVLVAQLAETPRHPIFYSGVCAQLGGRWAGMDPNSPRLAEALGHIVDVCRAARPALPALSARVVSKSTGRPGGGYFTSAHPHLSDRLEQAIEWGREVEAVRQQRARFPQKWGDLKRPLNSGRDDG